MSFNTLACSLSERVASFAATPFAQIGFIASCALWLACGGSEGRLTLVLSVVAISLSQMILLSQDKITKAEHAKLDAIIAGTDADDALQGIEREGV